MTTTGKDFSRQSFLGSGSEKILADARVTIVGLGGGGSHIAQQLAHVGVGHIRLIDPQEIEASNLNRLVGATQGDVKAATPKVEICERTILGIRPWINVVTARKTWQEVPDLISDAHILIGCIDGYRQRMYLETASRRYGVPYIDIGMDVAEIGRGQFAVAGQMIMTLPGGPCMKCLGFLTEDRLTREENLYGDAGMNPQVVWTNGMLASLAVGAAVGLLTPWHERERSYDWLELDGNEQRVVQSEQPRYSIRGPCPHFSPRDLGDPFFTL